MLDENTSSATTDPDTNDPAGTGGAPDEAAPESTPQAPTRTRRRAATRPSGPPVEATDAVSDGPAADTQDTASEPAAPPARRTRKKTVPAPVSAPADDGSGDQPAAETPKPAKKTTAKRASKKAAAPSPAEAATEAPTAEATEPAVGDPAGDPAGDPTGELFSAAETPPTTRRRRSTRGAAAAAPAEAVPADPETPPAAGPPAVPLFQPADPSTMPARPVTSDAADLADAAGDTPSDDAGADATASDDDGSATRRRRRRGGRRRRKSGEGGDSPHDETEDADVPAEQDGAAVPESAASLDKADEPGSSRDDEDEGSQPSTRRRRRRRRKGEPSDPVDDDPDNTVVKVRERRQAESEITSVGGSTRLEAKKQRRREGREAGRRRPPILSESEFLARRESVERQMVVRQRQDLIQIAVLEDNVLVEHYVARESQTSLIGNVYLGRVQNVLPSMEAAFIDIGKGRNAVLYAGEVDWSALGMDGKPRRIEEALSSGQHVLVQVSKDPVGNKGARLTAQISLPGRFLVYVPNGHTSGISRKLPEGERARLKGLLKDVVPGEAGVIIRTAAEGATEEQLTRDVGALTARWDDIAGKAKNKGQGPKLLYGEPDLMIKVVRDLFTEDFSSLVVQGDEAWDNIQAYVGHVAPDLADRCKRSEGESDAFAAYRIDEQIAKALDRKVFLPSGGSLVIDRTEAMTVVDVNTGKFTGSGGNLEETVTKNNLEAAEEIVRQLRLRDIGGIIVVDFIDMVLESNRDLVLRRMVECLSRDRTRHQVAEVTSLGLVQMTRKKIGTGLVEAFSEPCQHCGGRGLLVHTEPVTPGNDQSDDDQGGRRGGGRRRGGRPRGGEDEVRGAGGSDAGDKDGGGERTEVSPAPVTEPADEQSPAADAVDPVAPEPVTPPVAPAGPPVPPALRPTLDQPQAPDLPEAITPRRRTPRKRVTRGTAPPGPPAEQHAEPVPSS